MTKVIRFEKHAKLLGWNHCEKYFAMVVLVQKYKYSCTFAFSSIFQIIFCPESNVFWSRLP